MLSNKIKLGLICGSLFFISQNAFSAGCQDFAIGKNMYCTPDGSRLFKYGEVTQEMKNIKSTFRGKTYTYKDLIKPLNPDELVGIEEFKNKIRSFNNSLEENLNKLNNYSQFEQLLKVRGDYLEEILNNKFYNNSIINNLIDIDRKIISLFDKFKVTQENQKLFKTGSAEKHKTLEIMNNYIKYQSF
ncbi:hypothetical protein [Lonepinella sp. BR2357]|uniref:hypothetical protein n=1 Tax=Lonepinella sp. BR2357 TaxID=3434549 RepID=UPI003F6E32BA